MRSAAQARAADQKAITKKLMQETAFPASATAIDKLWALQIQYYRSHLDVFMEEYLGLHLADTQQYIARGISSATEAHVIQNRSYGKTWLMAAIAISLATLYPGTGIGVVSNTIEQANLLLNKIMDKFASVPVINAEMETKKLSASNKTTKVIEFHNGSFITSLSLGSSGDSARGWRLKVIIVDEARLVPKEIIKAVIEPITLETRDIVSRVTGMKDFESKIIYITSAYLKSCDYYKSFCHAVREMGKGNPDYFACAFDYNSCVRVGLREEKVFDRARRGMSDATFQMEYGSVFIGSNENSVFPFSLTEAVRTLKQVELAQRNHSTARYVIAADLATSQGRFGDNACLCVLKLIEHTNGQPWEKELVYMRSYHGKNAEELRDEIRALVLRFPGCYRLVVDVNGLGNCMPVLLDKPWINPDDPETEYPPIVLADNMAPESGALPLLVPFVASNKLNNAMVNTLRYHLEQKLIRLPLHSAEFDNSAVLDEETGLSKREAVIQHFAIYAEGDALQIELGNLIAYIGASGVIRYDVQQFGQHKDRFSALAMALYQASLIEEDARVGNDEDEGICWGITMKM